MKYVNILSTENGPICIAPAWTVNEGDLVTIDNPKFSGEKFLVLAVATDEENGDVINLLEKHYGGKLPKVNERFYGRKVVWDDDVHE